MDTLSTVQPKLSRRQRRKLRELAAPVSDTVKAIDKVAELVERATNDQQSKQPRFSNNSSNLWLNSIASFIRSMDLEPPDTSDPRLLDLWYRAFAFRESHLTGVLNSVIAIDKNRGWTLTGGRNQVNKYTSILHQCDNGAGWREFIAWQAQSYYTTRAGYIAEVGMESDADNAPLRALWSVDPCRIRLTGNVDYPLRYFPRNGSVQDWLPRDYLRGASMGSTDESQFGYGFPAVARCIDLARIMVAVYQHDNEQLGARAPRGLLLLNGISQGQWDDAMKARGESLDGLEREYFGGVAVLASSGVDEVTANLVALSTLPRDFDTEKFTALMMYGFALSFGYDPREFWPVSSGTLGTATETDTQHRKATSKGDNDFSLSFQEQLQGRLPATLQFEFNQRDVEGEQSDAALQLAQAQVITEINKWSIAGQNVLTAEQIMQLAAEAGVIPEEWTPVEEDITSTDTDAERIMSNRRIRQARVMFPSEDIVEYSSKTNRTKTIVRHDTQRQSYPVNIQRSIQSVASKFHADVRGLATVGFISDRSILGDMRSLVKNAVGDAYVAGLEEGGVAFDEMDADDARMIVELSTEQLDYVTDFVKAIRDAKTDKAAQRDILDNRVNLWTASITAAGQAGLASAKSNEMVTWKLGATKEHCKTCQSLNGQKHRRKWFASRGYFPGKPGAEALECKGFRCLCKLEV
jgi:hypothetical protein